jgi:predicted TIM-barrel fold metal-dependent hydrolase
MIGSDWPVLRLTGANYRDVDLLHKSLISGLSEADQAKIRGGNAAKFYQLKDLD